VAAVPETLIESELFGHARGAFTGATEARRGRVRSADRGCLFLDEVGDLPLTAQVKLLRVIETDHVQPLGSDQLHRADVRYVAATHQDLPALVRAGRFREDLYQRLAGVVIRLPALRERPEDIAAIGEQIIAAATRELALEVDLAAITRWLHGAEARRYAWPGNVRELRNVVRNLLLGLPSGLAPASRPAAKAAEGLPERIRSGEASLAEVETWYLRRALDKTHGNLAAAARLLGVDRSTVARKLQRA
jgi:DNA-binding NtrC family response regulator